MECKLPDNLTRYRVMVVAATEKQFGAAEANLTACAAADGAAIGPLSSTLAINSTLIVLQNQTDEPMTVDVAIDTANLAIEEQGQRVTVPANDRVAVRFEPRRKTWARPMRR